ncbi:auxin-responsive protein SAUR64-like [Prosopis cineraria]|uniref:auxin-responsive protein SAUR64-like n=1 Tax=Prosopis cineraria TaxID=364024 RepID=UPI00240F4EA7|nr:auxin-responsive protein SAUR64-like [Prosopis cineraria]
MARNWQKLVAGKRKRISCKREDVDMYSSAANKGHFVVYSTDHKRFVVPLKYLKSNVFKELLEWSEEEFGLASSGPLLLPCESVVLEYVISLVKERVPEDVQKVLIASRATCHSHASSLAPTPPQAIIHGY